MNKLYLGNLSFALREDELRSFIEGCGVKFEEVNIITDRYTGRSRGFGFLKLAEDQDPTEAREALDGKEVGGRPLKVDRAHQRERKPYSY